MSWIPCDTRMPPADELVLISIVDRQDIARADVGRWDDERWSWYDDEFGHFAPRIAVVAWQPLPGPYQP